MRVLFSAHQLKMPTPSSLCRLPPERRFWFIGVTGEPTGPLYRKLSSRVVERLDNHQRFYSRLRRYDPIEVV